MDECERCRCPNFTAPNTPGAAFYGAIVSSGEAGCTDAISNTANITLDASVGVAAEPQNITQCVGGTQPLSVTGTGTGTIVYQWQSATAPGGTFGNTGTNQNTLALNTAAPSTQYFRVIVSSPNALCRDTSIEVTATVVADPSISLQPVNVSGCVGDAISLNVNASGGIAPLNYQWQGAPTAGGPPWIDIPGANSETLNPPSVAGTAFARVVVSSTGTGCDAATSAIATVTLDEKVSITADPQDISQCVGGSATLSATTAGAGPVTNGNNPHRSAGRSRIRLAQPKLRSPRQPARPARRFSACCSIHKTATAATPLLTVAATVVADPQITVQPQGLEACVGGSATLSSSFFRWHFSRNSVAIKQFRRWPVRTNLTGANAATYDPPLSMSGTTYYRMLVSSSSAGCDDATSSAAEVLLHPKVDITAAPA